MADWLSYSTQGATRNQPISSDLVRAMSFLPEMGVTMNVYSGGQPSSGPNRVGSTRHDDGNAADVIFRQNGRVLDWNNPSDLPILSNIVAQARANGVTGIGAGDDYMGAGRFHVGFGTPSVWGAGGKADNAPEWLRSAYYGTKPPAGAGAPPIMGYAAPRQPTPPAGAGAPLFMAYAAQRQPTPAAAAAANAANGQQDRGFFGNLVANVRGALPQIGMPEISPQFKNAAIGALMGSVAGRTAVIDPFIQGIFTGGGRTSTPEQRATYLAQAQNAVSQSGDTSVGNQLEAAQARASGETWRSRNA